LSLPHLPLLFRCNRPDRNLYRLRGELLSSFEEALAQLGLLDRYKVTGVVVSWWKENEMSARVLRIGGFPAVIDSWITSFRAEIEDEDGRLKLGKINLGEHRLISRLLPDYIMALAEAEDRAAELAEQQAAFERGESFDEEAISDYVDLNDIGEDDKINAAKILDNRRKQIAADLHEQKKARAQETAPLEAELTRLEALLEPYKTDKKAAAEAKRILRDLKKELLTQLEMKRKAMTTEDCRMLVLSIFREELEDTLLDYIGEHRRAVVAVVENWWDKYISPLCVIEPTRDKSVVRLNTFLKQLGYE